MMNLISLLPGFARRALRKAILAYGRRLNVQGMLAVSRRRATSACLRAARESMAYRRLLEERGMNPARLDNTMDLSRLPVLTKANTFERFTLQELSIPMSVSDLGDVLTSSGRSRQGGRSFGFKLTSRRQHRDSWFDTDLGLQDVFGVDEKPTLLVNCLPMGVTFQSRSVTVANVSVREDMACAILRDVGPRFKQTLICADPLFVRRLLNEARAAGVDWPSLNTSVILGEEMLVESQRDFLASQLGINIDRDPHRLIGSSFGLGELGLNLLFETRETIRVRRAMRRDPAIQSRVCGSAHLKSMPSLFCYNPLRCHVEIIEPGSDGFGELCITMLDRDSIIPLPRYATGDVARLVNEDEAAMAATILGIPTVWLPMVALKGRIKDQGDGGPSVEDIKELLYLDHSIAECLTGAFKLANDRNNGHRLKLQTNEKASVSPDFAARIRRLFEIQGLEALKIELTTGEDGFWGPILDFERKFPYREAS